MAEKTTQKEAKKVMAQIIEPYIPEGKTSFCFKKEILSYEAALEKVKKLS